MNRAWNKIFRFGSKSGVYWERSVAECWRSSASWVLYLDCT